MNASVGYMSQMLALSVMSVQATTTKGMNDDPFGNNFANDLMMEYINDSFIFLHQ